MKMRQPLRLRKRAEFLALRTGEKRRGPLFLLEVKKRLPDTGRQENDGPDNSRDTLPRVGFTVTRKNGNAVMRNRIKRRLREAVRIGAAGDMLAGTDYVIVARPEVIDVSFERLVRELRNRIRQKKKNR